MSKTRSSKLQHWIFEGAVLVAALSSFASVFVLVHYPPETAWYLAKFAVAQWTPYPFLDLSYRWQQEAWNHWEEMYLPKLRLTAGLTEQTNDNISDNNKKPPKAILDIPTAPVQDLGSDPVKLLHYLEETYGDHWRRKPLLLKGLWNADELIANTTRRLSHAGLLQEALTIPYFKDARIVGALAPNGKAPVKDIVANISRHGAPHKIGTQLLIQTYPELIQEVAPNDIVTHLFGDHFQPQHVQPKVPFLPASTTVPLFVAGSQLPRDKISDNEQDSNGNTRPSSSSTTAIAEPFTGLHCEPIGNVAVQLEGEKQWTLVSPEYSLMLRPSASADGRAFFVSGLTSDEELESIPRYYATTRAGDALWVPTWTWHRVDYRISRQDTKVVSEGESQPVADIHEKGTSKIAIGASLFHLRPLELLGNNPLFAVLVIPNLIKEIFRFKTQ